MDYVSTRDVKKHKVSASEAIAAGLAPDGGLYVPETMPALPEDLWINMAMFFAGEDCFTL